MAVADGKAVVELHHARQAGAEVLKILLLGLAPLHLADGIETGQEHEEKVLGGGDVLRPQVYLRAEDVLLLFL